jgi:hypothetical protein
MVKIEPHGGSVNLDNTFDYVWRLLSEGNDVNLKTEKKKTHFVAKALMVPSRDSNKSKKTIVFLRRLSEGGRLQEVATCFDCCWGLYYSCYSRGIGMYCKALDKWASALT